MVVLSSVISYMIGIPLGIALVVTDKDGIRPVPAVQQGGWDVIDQPAPFGAVYHPVDRW